MSSSEADRHGRGFLALAASRPVVVRAFEVAAIVGTLLALINHGDKILSSSLDAWSLGQILLTYLVPFSVSVWSSVRTLQSRSPGRGESTGSGIGH